MTSKCQEIFAKRYNLGYNYQRYNFGKSVKRPKLNIIDKQNHKRFLMLCIRHIIGLNQDVSCY